MIILEGKHRGDRCTFPANPIAVPEQPDLAGSALGGIKESFSANPGQNEAPVSPGRIEQEAPQHAALLCKGTAWC